MAEADEPLAWFAVLLLDQLDLVSSAGPKLRRTATCIARRVVTIATDANSRPDRHVIIVKAAHRTMENTHIAVRVHVVPLPLHQFGDGTSVDHGTSTAEIATQFTCAPYSLTQLV